MRMLESMDLNFLLIYFIFDLVLIVVTVWVARRLGRSAGVVVSRPFRVDPPGFEARADEWRLRPAGLRRNPWR